MSGLDNMRKRLNYQGGIQQVSRMNADKLRSLKKALLYSYQSGTIELADGRQFRALINKDKEKATYDDKVLSIPFEDICLNKPRVGKTSEGIEPIGLKEGMTFTWLPYNATYIPESHYIIYLRYNEETAYFRGELRECNQDVNIDGETYYVWFKGPEQDSIEWQLKFSKNWNKLNYSRIMYITKDEKTLDYFHRFKQLYVEEDGSLAFNINDEPKSQRWMVAAVDPVYGEGIIRVALEEYYGNTVPDVPVIEKQEESIKKIVVPAEDNELIFNAEEYYVFDTLEVSAKIPNPKYKFKVKTNIKDCKIVTNTSQSLTIELGGKSGDIEISYNDLTQRIHVKSL